MESKLGTKLLIIFMVSIVLGAVFSRHWDEKIDRFIEPGNHKANNSLVAWQPTGTAAPAPPLTLKQILCQLDAKACKLKLRYSIENLDWGGTDGSSHFVGFAWPKDRTWMSTQCFLEDGGVAVYIADQYPTQAEAAISLLNYLNAGGPNYPASHREPEASRPRVILKAPIVGPESCDPHKTCQ